MAQRRQGEHRPGLRIASIESWNYGLSRVMASDAACIMGCTRKDWRTSIQPSVVLPSGFRYVVRGKDVGGAIVVNQTSTGLRAAAIEGRGYGWFYGTTDERGKRRK